MGISKQSIEDLKGRAKISDFISRQKSVSTSS